MATAVDGSLARAELGVKIGSASLGDASVGVVVVVGSGVEDEVWGARVGEGVGPVVDVFGNEDAFVGEESFPPGFGVESLLVASFVLSEDDASDCELCSTEGSSSPEKRRLIPQMAPKRTTSETSAMAI